MPHSVVYAAARFVAACGLVFVLVLAGARPSWTRSVRPPPTASYTLTELGTVPGGGSSAARAVNASGEVTGHVDTAGGARAFLWDRSAGMRSLGTLTGDLQSYGTGINADGEICGISLGANGPHAFLWSKAEGMRALPPLPSGASAAAYGINIVGQVVGTSDYVDPKGNRRSAAVVWESNGAIEQLPALETHLSNRASAAIAINDSGQVTGFQPITETVRGRAIVRDQPFIWDATTGLKLLARSRGTGGRPLASNVSGQVLGLTLTANGQKDLPSAWGPAGNRILDSATQLAAAGPFQEKLGGINATGEIVYSLFARKPGGGVATLYQAGTAVDLNRLIAPNAAIHLYTAAAINDSGQIVGALADKRGTQSRAYLLTPRTPGVAGAPELPVNLGTAGNFIILAKAGISTTGTTHITGDIGVSPIDHTAITGFGLVLDGSGTFSTSPQVTGRVYAADYANPTPVMLSTAVGDMETAYTDAAGRTNPDATEINAGDLGGLNLAPGLYKWSSNVTIPSNLTLTGNGTDVWIFQIAGTLNISSDTAIILAGGARASNIFWQSSGQATLGTNSVFNGNILSMTAIVVQTGARLNGRALAQTAVTLDSNDFPGLPAPLPPTIDCPLNVMVNTDPGLCTASNVMLGSPTTTGTGVSVMNDAPLIFPLGTTIVIWTATDGDGLTATCSQSVTVLDVQPPTIACPTNVSVPVDPGMMTASGVMLGTPTGMDNCPGVTFTGVRSDGQDLPFPYPLGMTTITWTATDAAGNTASCSQTVTVTPRPTITCPSNVMANTDPGLCTASNVALGTPTTTGVGVTVANDAPTVFPLGVTMVTWTATDSGGLTATCVQNVTVLDAQPPTITCPVAVTTSVDPGMMTASGVMLGTPTGMDNCPGVAFNGVRSDSQPLNDPYPLGPTTVTWTASDAAGNTASCSQTVTVTAAPTITCPANVMVNTDPGLCTASNVALGTPTTTGTGVVVTNNAPTVFPRGTTIVIWTATDSGGLTATCSQSVIVLDVQPPTLTCPTNVTVPVDPGMMTASGVMLGTPTGTDNCPGVTFVGVRSDSQPLTATYPLGATTITWTATDAAGNTASCSQTVTVTAGPTITCPANVMVNTDPALCTASNVPLGTPTTTGTGVTVANNAPAIFPLGVTMVTWTATDNNGRTATCMQSVTVRDAQAPTITCAADVTVPADPGQSTASGVVLGSQVVTDNCPDVTSVGTRSDGQALSAPYPLGTTTITWTATDAAGNTASCPQTVTVTARPTITCPANVQVNTDPALCTASNVALGTPTTTGTGITLANNAPAVFPLGVTTVTWTATDSDGLTATCMQSVTVRDAQAPTITCAADVTVEADPGQSTASDVDLGSQVVMDNCPGVTSVGIRSDGQALTAPYPVGTTTITWTATDAAGNTASCPQTVTVTASLSITCPPEVNTTTDAGRCTASNVSLGTPTTTGTGVVVSNNAPKVFPVGVTMVTWTARDSGNNTVTCQQKVTVTDAEAPRLTCPRNISRKTLLKGPIKLKIPAPKATDNCGFVNVVCSPPMGGRFKVGKTTVTCTATDTAGNTTTCTFIVTLVRCR